MNNNDDELEIVDYKVNTINQYKILSFLKNNLELDLFKLYIYDKDTIKVVDNFDNSLLFKFDDLTNEVYYFEEELEVIRGN